MSECNAIHDSLVLPTLVGPYAKLRHITVSDADDLRVIFGDPQVVRYMGMPLLRTDEQVQELLLNISTGIQNKTLFQWGLTRLDSDTLIGTGTLSHIDWINQRAEIGFALASSQWGRGIMRAALPVLIDHAFTSLALHRLEADVDPRNAKSLRLLQFFGFEREGYLRERHLASGERQDTVLLGLLAPAWQRSRQSASASMPRETQAA
jgi:[ribosomal protein S5]-alanine N-acetyltransferase